MATVPHDYVAPNDINDYGYDYDVWIRVSCSVYFRQFENSPDPTR